MISSVTNDHCFDLRGLSTDTPKPTEWGGVSIGNGSTFFEIDTGKLYIFDADGATWVEVSIGS